MCVRTPSWHRCVASAISCRALMCRRTPRCQNWIAPAISCRALTCRRTPRWQRCLAPTISWWALIWASARNWRQHQWAVNQNPWLLLLGDRTNTVSMFQPISTCRRWHHLKWIQSVWPRPYRKVNCYSLRRPFLPLFPTNTIPTTTLPVTWRSRSPSQVLKK